MFTKNKWITERKKIGDYFKYGIFLSVNYIYYGPVETRCRWMYIVYLYVEICRCRTVHRYDIDLHV